MNNKYELVPELSILDTDGTRLYRIRALRDIATNHGNGEVVHKGDLGGFVESEQNLSLYSDAWIFDDSIVRDNAILRGGATISRSSVLCGNALAANDAMIKGSYLCDNATVVGYTHITDSLVCENAIIGGFTNLYKSKVLGNASVFNTRQMMDIVIDKDVGRIYQIGEEREVSKYLMIPYGNMFRIMALRDINNPYRAVKKGEYGGLISHSSNLSQTGECWVFDNSIVSRNATVQDNAVVSGNSRILGDSVVCEHAFVRNSIVYDRAFLGGGSKAQYCKIGRFMRILGSTALKGERNNNLEISSSTKNMVNLFNSGDINYIKQNKNQQIFAKNL